VTETSINLKVGFALLSKELAVTVVVSFRARKVSSKIEVKFLSVFVFHEESVGVTPHGSAGDD